ncbi:MAG: Crp/Fnr family transcriptional regulator [Methyloligellaceae bacterium]
MSDGPDVRAILASDRLFQGLPEASLDRLAALVRPRRVPTEKIVYREGDTANGCYVIIDGTLKVSRFAPDGDEIFLAVVGGGDVIGEMALVDRMPRSATVTTLRDCELGHVALNDFEKLAVADQEIYRHLSRALSTRLRASNETLTLQQRPMDERLARLFVHLADGFGETLPDGRILIRHKFSQVQLGQMAACARENVSRQLKQWRSDELISRVSGYYCLEKPEQVRDIARL